MGHLSKIPYLPEDIVNSILLELPVKSLLRFKISCKSWCSSIDDPDFIQSHIHKSSTDITRQKFLFLDVVRRKIRGEYEYKISSTEAPITADSKVVSYQPNIKARRSTVQSLQVRSCNGLIFIYHDERMILWNPAIRKHKLIPYCDPDLLCPKFGFAYDFVAEDYKVLCVYEELTGHYIANIYSVKNQTWRTIEDMFPVPTDYYRLYLFGDLVLLNGVIHMIALSWSNTEFEHSVISFHLADEKFIATLLPSNCRKHLKLCAFCDRVCVIGNVDKEIFIWSLEKDGITWNNIRKFPALSMLIGKPLYSGNVICVNEYGDIGDLICIKENGNVLWRINDGRFIEYDVRENKYTEFYLEEIGQNENKNTLYVESLVHLNM